MDRARALRIVDRIDALLEKIRTEIPEVGEAVDDVQRRLEDLNDAINEETD